MKTKHLDATVFNNAMRSMGSLMAASGVAMRDIVRSEAGSIIRAAAKATKQSRASTINAYFARNTASESTKNYIVKKGKTAGRNRSYRLPGEPTGKNLRNFGWKIKNDQWNRYQANQKRKRTELLARRGIARQSILKMADDLDLKIDESGLATARKARYRGRVREHKSTGIQFSLNKESFGITLSNRTPMIRGSRMEAAFKRAISGRVGYYRRNLKHGVFENMNSIAKAYPGFSVSR